VNARCGCPFQISGRIGGLSACSPTQRSRTGTPALSAWYETGTLASDPAGTDGGDAGAEPCSKNRW
jgi:hypothetical protein